MYSLLVSMDGANVKKKFREMFILGAQKVGDCTLDHMCTPRVIC